MPSSYNVIKNTNVVSQSEKVIETNFEIEREKAVNENNARIFIDSYESLSRSIVENARKKSEEILTKAFEDACRMQSESEAKAKEVFISAKEKGYSEGTEKGYSDAYKEGYEKNIQIAKKEAEAIRKNAENMLFSARHEYDDFLKEKQDEIKALVLTVIKNVLKKEVNDKDALDCIVFDAISSYKDGNVFIISCKEQYVQSIKENILGWKEKLALKADIFVVPDEELNDGEAVIQRDSGKITVSVDYALKKIEEILSIE